jgi:hypothetical protein
MVYAGFGALWCSGIYLLRYSAIGRDGKAQTQMKTIKSLSILFAVLFVVFVVHWLLLSLSNQVPNVQLLLLSYGVNFAMAAIIVIALLRLPKRFQQSLGFFFLFGSLFKFLVYFLLFRPVYQSDGAVSKVEFFSFFIPYVFSLIIETTILIAKLKAEDHSTKTDR